MKKIWLGMIPLLLSGCEAIGNWADGVGKHIPVMGERCEHWECMSDSGKQKSDEIKRREAAAEKAAQKPTAK